MDKINTEIYYMDVTDWPCCNFTPEEIACKGTGKLIINKEALLKLDELRDILGVPFSPNSAYRSEAHNKAVGGAKNSYHRKGVAFDIPIKLGMGREKIKKAAVSVGFKGIGDYNTFIHVDDGPERYWDRRK